MVKLRTNNENTKLNSKLKIEGRTKKKKKPRKTNEKKKTKKQIIYENWTKIE